MMKEINLQSVKRFDISCKLIIRRTVLLTFSTCRCVVCKPIYINQLQGDINSTLMFAANKMGGGGAVQ